MITNALREIFRTNLGVKKTERVLVFTDKFTKKDELHPGDRERWERLEDIALLTSETGRSFAKEIIFCDYSSRGGHGMEPPESIYGAAFGKKTVEELKGHHLFGPILHKKVSPHQLEHAEEIISKHSHEAVHAVIALSNYSTSHTRFRDFLTRLCGTRYASMPLFDVDMFEAAMDVDWKALEKKTLAITKVVNHAEKIRITTPNGTRITLSKKGRKAISDTGNLRRRGAFGNLPAGEVYIAPLEGTAKGKLVLEWAPTRHLTSPITLSVKDGNVLDIVGDEEYTEVIRKKLAERKENANIAELGIGTNDRATRPDNILEAEKISGTIHIAFGDNSSFGGTVKTPFHQDFVFFKPTITLMNKDGSKNVLMRRGKFSELG